MHGIRDVPYIWRKLSRRQQQELLEHRKLLGRPWHRPPHLDFGCRHYLLTAACYEHRHVIGTSVARMGAFCEALLDCFDEPPAAWCVLPNHYHVLVRAEELKPLFIMLGRLHGRSSRLWNQEDGTTGRRIWYRISDRAIRGVGHFWATLNYIHHNPVKHGYTERWEEWSFSSATDYLKSMGKNQARMIWKQYPIGEYGKKWDEMEGDLF